MGNRILKESICMSAEIDALSWFEEAFFYRLIVTVDDFGIYPADPVMLAHILFPRKDNVSRKAVEEALNHLEQLGLIHRWHHPGKGDFLQMVSWQKHQRLRNSRRKFPAPEEAKEDEAPKGEEAPKADAEAPPEHPEETQPEASAPLPVITLPLNDGTEFPVSQEAVDEYTALYPAVDILQELRAMRGWCLSNDQKRKTRSGIRRFMNSWLARAQDKGGTGAIPAKTPAYANPYQAMAFEGEIV